MIGTVLGGVGIFLLGMILLTEGLRAAAGEALRTLLQRFARTPFTALCTGTGVTAVVQSSSATTLTTIGFVSAGLLTFPQAVGVIFGANLGTTSTGWLVSTLGLKVSLSVVAFPMVGIGALVRLLARGKVAQGGMALAGFGLIFVGIDTLQLGMQGLAERLDPGAFPGATLSGRVLLVVLGGVMTVVMQSSSAAVATTLTGLHTGTLGLEQAALLVVGQNMGTTVKAALASVGGSVPVRRTALAHILFNLFTGALALVLLPLLLAGALGIAGEGDPAVAIAIFHTSFNILGVAALFPFLGRFADLVERFVPEGVPTLTRNLHPSVVEVPAVAVEAARGAGIAVARELFHEAANALDPTMGRRARDPRGGQEESPEEALRRIRSFLTDVPSAHGSGDHFRRHLSVLHAADHLDRFRRALAEDRWVDPPMGNRLAGVLRDWIRSSEEEGPGPEADGLHSLAETFSQARKRQRAQILAEAVEGRHDPSDTRRKVDGLLRLDRLAYHAWRAAFHLRAAAPDRSGAEWDEDYVSTTAGEVSVVGRKEGEEKSSA
ncbi:MAG: Na/Pi cotransporter family protein [Gemmatimonadales bacterium]|nr:MAG: Na/Pi cotransporter family protein [Gemmatimonadales bacterium]